MTDSTSVDRTTLSALSNNSSDNGCLNCPGTLAALRYARTSPNEQLIIMFSLFHLHNYVQLSLFIRSWIVFGPPSKIYGYHFQHSNMRMWVNFNSLILTNFVKKNFSQSIGFSQCRRVSYLADLIRGFTAIQLSGYTERFHSNPVWDLSQSKPHCIYMEVFIKQSL